MGLVSGKTASQDSGLTPKFDVLGSGTNYEIRAYAPYLVAEVQALGGEGSEDDRFRTLAQYIGVFGSPANKVAGGEGGEKISMTAPVVVGSPSSDPGTKISMTAPVVVTPGAASTMQFILPTAFKAISDAPLPTDERVSLREVPEHLYLVRQFSGNMGSADAHDGTVELQRMVTEEGTKADGGTFSEYVGVDSKVLVARYNPPWTLPFLKTNELWFPLPLSREEATAKLPSA